MMAQLEPSREWRRWLPAMGLVALLHGAAWWGYAHFKSEIVPPKPLPVVQVTLLAPPVPFEPRIEPPRPLPPKATERQPQRAVAVPMPVPAAPPVAENAVQQQAQVAIAAPQPAPVVAPPAPEPAVEPPRYNAAYLSNPKPVYPLSARRRGIEGRALIRAEISLDGECLRAELKQTSGHDMLDHAALEAVKKWRFVPARRGSQAVVEWVEVPITFKLENN